MLIAAERSRVSTDSASEQQPALGGYPARL
jgi:hypothetical protein